MAERCWIDVATFYTVAEAELAVARLERVGIHAARERDETIELAGNDFERVATSGITLLVPAELLEDARDVLRPAEGPA